MKKSDQLVLVLGMHRSGTSAIAKRLESFGVNLGETLIPGKKDNIKGYQEDADFVQINRKIISWLGGDAGASLKQSRLILKDIPINYQIEARKILSDRAGKYNNFGVKDPRFCLLLPFWLPLLKESFEKISIIFAYRNPANVIASLVTRQDAHPEKSYYLWLQYVAISLNDLSNHNFEFVNFDSLFEKGAHGIDKIFYHLSPEGQRPDINKINEYNEKWLDKKLRHHQLPIQEIEAYNVIPKEVKQLASVIEMVISGKLTKDSLEFRSALDSALEKLDELGELLFYLEKKENEVVGLRKDRRELADIHASIFWKTISPLRNLLLGRDK